MKTDKNRNRLLSLSLFLIFIALSTLNPLRKTELLSIGENQDFQGTIINAADSAITLITPENITYGSWENGLNSSTFDFNYDTIGTFPEGWTQAGSGPYGAKTTVVSSKDGHNEVIYIHDDQGNMEVSPYQEFSAEQTSGSIDLWIYFENRYVNIASTAIRIENSSGDALVNIYAYDNGLRYSNGTDTIDTGLSVVNQWLHVSMDFSGDGTYKNLDPNSYNFTFHKEDGSLFYQSPIVNYSANSVGNAARFRIFSSQDEWRNTWFDAVNYSWYDIGEKNLILKYSNAISLSWVGYSMDDQANITLPSPVGGSYLIPQPPDGIHTVQLFANESDGTIHSSFISNFIVDTVFPTIKINFPNPNDIIGKTAPSFDVELSDANLDLQWYSLDGGIINTTFSGSIGEIDQSLWENCADGNNTIRFSVNDTGSHGTSLEITVEKDATNPVISIITPQLGNEYVNPPSYKLSINEKNLYSVWYSLDGGLTNITYNALIPINPDIWAAAPSGQFNITFYVKDIAGNEAFEEIFVVKTNIPVQGIEPILPYIIIFSSISALLVLGMAILLRTVILMKKKMEAMERRVTLSQKDLLASKNDKK